METRCNLIWKALNLMKKNVHAVLFGSERLINLGD